MIILSRCRKFRRLLIYLTRDGSASIKFTRKPKITRNFEFYTSFHSFISGINNYSRANFLPGTPFYVFDIYPPLSKIYLHSKLHKIIIISDIKGGDFFHVYQLLNPTLFTDSL